MINIMLAAHDVYDSNNQTWSSLADMEIPVHGVTGAAFVGSVIYATGDVIDSGGRTGVFINQAYKHKRYNMK
jgi:hypothetical protein